MKVSCVWPFVTPWTVTHQAPLPMGFSRQEFWGGLPCPSPGDLPNPGNEHRSPALQADSLPFEPPGKPSNSKRGLNQNQRLAKGCHRWPFSVVHSRVRHLTLVWRCVFTLGSLFLEILLSGPTWTPQYPFPWGLILIREMLLLPALETSL